jgi:anti-anti-sigma regulatory factor
VIEPNIVALTAIMAEELVQKVYTMAENEPFNVIVKLSHVQQIEDKAAAILAGCRMQLYNNNHSFVVCSMQEPVMERITELQLEDAINVTPTESEAWDIVQMDEIERDFLTGEA